MFSPPKPRTFLLMLSGVHLSDISGDEMFDNLFMEQMVVGATRQFEENCEEYDEIKNLDCIPKKFSTLKKWPTSTNLRCWECGMHFSGRPAFIPKTIHEESYGALVYDVEGNFCTFNCAAKFSREKYPQTHLKYKEYMIFIYNRETKKNIINIKDPPQRTLMCDYCGPQGISEEKFEELKKENALKFQ